MPFIEINSGREKTLILVHHITSIETTDNGNCNINVSNGDKYYDIKTYDVVKSLIKESKMY